MSGGQNIGDVPGLAVSLTVLCVIAVLLNVLVIIVFSTKPQTRSSVDMFIINLCLSDILLAGIALPVRLNNGSHHGEDFKGGNFLCKAIMFIPKLTISCSITTMVAIAVDRARELIKRKKLTPRTATYVIFAIWMWAIALSSPNLYEYSTYMKYEEEYNATSCGSHDILENFETVYAAVMIILSYAIPSILITISYVQIIIFVWKAGKTLNGKESQVLKKRMKIVRLLIIITVVFVVLWCPYFVLFGMEEVLGLDDTAHTGSGQHITKNVFVVLSTMSNPIIYFISDDSFRKNFIGLLTGRPCSGHNAIFPEPPSQIQEINRKQKTNSEGMRTHISTITEERV